MSSRVTAPGLPRASKASIMMHGRHIELMQHQQRLRIRSAELRLRLANEAQVLETPLALIDQARAGVTWLRRHPQWLVGALALLGLIRPQRATRWAARLWWGWGLYQRMQQRLGKPPQLP